MKNISAKNPVRHWLEPWHVDPSANRNYDFVDGLRGIAILMVLVCHSIHAREQQDFVARYLLCFRDTLGRGVDLFFTLSGFLISWPFWKRKANNAPLFTCVKAEIETEVTVAWWTSSKWAI